jgi:hypothetical protein
LHTLQEAESKPILAPVKAAQTIAQTLNDSQALALDVCPFCARGHPEILFNSADLAQILLLDVVTAPSRFRVIDA